jgi:hypothetical protein
MTLAVISRWAIGQRPIVSPVFLAVMTVHVTVVGPSIALTTHWFALPRGG